MLFKIVVFAAVLAVALFALRKLSPPPAARRRRDPEAAPRRAAAHDGDIEDLRPCPSCGAYVVKGEICDCDRNPTP